MKKKALTLCVATILGLSSGTVAMAAPINSAGGTDRHAVYGTYQPEGEVATVYAVDVSWGSWNSRIRMELYPKHGIHQHTSIRNLSEKEAGRIKMERTR